MNNIITPRPDPKLWSAALITAIGMGVIFVIDSTIYEVTCAPIIGVCIMFLLSLRYSPKTVAFCVIPLCIFVAYRMWNILNLTGTDATHITRYWIRMSTFVVAGSIAIAASGYRAQLDRITFQLLRILEAIPLPLIISDSNGTIRAVSETTCLTSGLPREQLIGFRLSDIVGYHLLEEADEDWYQHWLESPEGKVFEVELQLGKHRSPARVGRLGSGKHAILIVLFT